MTRIDLILIAAIGSTTYSIICFIAKLIRNKYLKMIENVEGEFTFYIKKVKEKDLVCLGLRNSCKKKVDFDPKQGVCIKWEKGYHKINLPEDRIASTIPPRTSKQLKTSTQLNYEVNLSNYERSIISSKKIRVFIYTTRNNKFELQPTSEQLKIWKKTKRQ